MGVSGYKKKVRGAEQRKRTRFVFVVTEGKNKTETNYFRQFSNKTVRFKFVSGTATDPVKMSNDLVKQMNTEGFDRDLGDCAYCLVDGDNAQYKNQQIAEADDIARKNGFSIILSNPCFEIWYLCHYCFSAKQYKCSDDAVDELRKYIPQYTKAQTNMKEELEASLPDAVVNAKRLEEWNDSLERKKHTVEYQPSTEVYKIIEDLSLK